MLQRRQEMQAAAERALAASKQRKVTPQRPHRRRCPCCEAANRD